MAEWKQLELPFQTDEELLEELLIAYLGTASFTAANLGDGDASEAKYLVDQVRKRFLSKETQNG